jgi:hypothetical protein
MSRDIDSRDINYVCTNCLGDIVAIGEKDGWKNYKCIRCGEKLKECTVCHLPRSIWGGSGNICSGCAIDAITGKIKLTEDQFRGINEWVITVKLR